MKKIKILLLLIIAFVINACNGKKVDLGNDFYVSNENILRKNHLYYKEESIMSSEILEYAYDSLNIYCQTEEYGLKYYYIFNKKDFSKNYGKTIEWQGVVVFSEKELKKSPYWDCGVFKANAYELKAPEKK